MVHVEYCSRIKLHVVYTNVPLIMKVFKLHVAYCQRSARYLLSAILLPVPVPVPNFISRVSPLATHSHYAAAVSAAK
jgi:hypothetical protein